jgi:D-alanyl-D-alanine carboxypeptidase/D-alanyl-D-alanine-endopeptidase (penicillin-binding protein 4)
MANASCTLLVAVVLLLLPMHLHGASVSESLKPLLTSVPAGGSVAVLAIDLNQGAILYEHNPDTALRLASLTKLLVSAAALWDLGSAYTFHTRLIALGPAANGSIPGLGIIGGGDPCLDEHFYDSKPDNVFITWAKELKAAGITRIDGDLVIDARLFAGPAKPATYPQDDDNQQRWYSAPASAFAWNDNCIEVRAVPTAAGKPCTIQVRPRSKRIAVTNLTKTAAGKGDSRFQVKRDADSNTITVSGSYSKATDWFPLSIHADPDLLAGDHLKAVFAEQSLPISGAVRLGEVPATGDSLIDLSHDLIPAVTLMNQRSQNFYGEQLLRLLGAHRFQDGSIDAGRRALQAVLSQHLDAGHAITVLDGCGLSYDNRCSARTIAHLLRKLHDSPLRDVFHQSLKEQAYGAVKGRVKTGSLAVASNLAGYFERPNNGGRVAFVILVNKGTAPSFGWASGLRDRLARALAQVLAGN